MSSSSASEALRSVLMDFDIRQQVESCVQEMVTDVEYAHHLSAQLQHELERQHWESLHRAQQEALEESYWERQTWQQQSVPLADALVQDLYRTSRQLGQYYQLQSQHNTLAQDYDALFAKLLQAEDQIRILQEQKDRIVPHGAGSATPTADAPTTNVDATSQDTTTKSTTGATAAAIATTPSSATPSSATTRVDEPNDSTPAQIASVQDELGEPATEAASEQPVQEPISQNVPTSAALTDSAAATMDNAGTMALFSDKREVTNPELTSDQVPKVPKPTGPLTEPVVSLELGHEAQEKEPRLEHFEDTILMNIFAFLDALEILNTAQINVAMYSRVDSLFGLGDAGHDNTTISSSADDEDYGASTTAMGSTATTNNYTTAATTTTTNNNNNNNTIGPSSAATRSESSTARQPPPRTNSTGGTTAGTSTTAVATTGTNTSASTGGGGILQTAPSIRTAALNIPQQQASAVMNNVFQFLQPRRPTTTTGNPSTPTRRGAGGGTGTNYSPPVMNAATASSVAGKLTDAELNAIVSMMERMRKKEAEVERLKAENGRIRAEWDGTESVKNFLIQKVREMEESLSRQEDNEIKVAQQIASDQEVIAFLDARVQELEAQVSQWQETETRLETERDKVRSHLEQKNTVLQDMLQFERERFVEFEKEAKSTKKVLIKEIKLCRNQIVALTAERDAYKEQNQTLQKAVLHSSSAGGAAERIYA